MEQRAILAVAASLAILLLYNELILPTMYPAGSDAPRIESDGGPPVPEPGVVPPLPMPVGDPAAAVREIAPEADAPVRRLTVETDHYIATLSSFGGRLESFRLKDHRTSVEPDSLGLEMVEPGEGGELPLAVELRGLAPDSGKIVTTGDRGATYEFAETGTLRLRGADERVVEMRWDGPAGTIRKRLTFRGNRRDLGLQVSATGVQPEYSQLGVTWFAPVHSTEHEDLFDRVSYLEGRSLNDYYLDESKLLNGVLVEPPRTSDAPSWEWVSVSGRHFMVAMVPGNALNGDAGRLGAAPTLFLKQRTVEGSGRSQHRYLRAQLLYPMPGNALSEDVTLYLGAKSVDHLEDIGFKLSRAVDLGWFSFIALPLLWMLRQCHALTGNYGVDIILVTVLVKIIFLPLTHKSFVSMRGMQKLQPEMQRLREQLKDKPEQMQKEMMELYRTHGVNPLGGCLPMLVQIPVFIGLYQALMNAVELRHAPFFAWINDLSAPDRLGSLGIPLVDPPGIPILTLIMGASMFLQQWMTPAMGDPMQRRIMMLLPVVFTFMFISFPSGLVLYWTINNLLTIAQQAYIHKTAD